MSSLSVGIIGLPNVGKSTLFNALLGRQVADVAEYPFCTIEPNVGIVEVPDERLDRLWKGIRGLRDQEVKKVPAAIRFVDIAGLVKGAHKGEGLGNQFLAHIREADVICHVVRDFEAPNVARVGPATAPDTRGYSRAGGSSDPKSDIELVNTELILKDLETVEKSLKGISRAERLKKAKKIEVKLSAFEKIKTGLSEGKLAKDIRLSEKEEEVARELFLLTSKPVIYVRNVEEKGILRPSVPPIPIPPFRDRDQDDPGTSLGIVPWLAQNDDSIVVSAKLESELGELVPEERQEYSEELGIKESGLDRLIKSCYKLLDLITFFTIEGGKQIQAWPIKKGSTVLEAAAMVHSDFAEKFIRAEIAGFEDLVNAGSWEKMREMGRVRVEGKRYVVEDEDVVTFKI